MHTINLVPVDYCAQLIAVAATTYLPSFPTIINCTSKSRFETGVFFLVVLKAKKKHDVERDFCVVV